MPFAAVVTVKFQGSEPEVPTYLRETLVPRLKAQPGFQSARFLRSLDGKTGVGTTLWDTEANAKAGLDAATTNRPPEAPKVENTALYEVMLEA
jgi:heme-degrading monooxygenase HmoA